MGKVIPLAERFWAKVVEDGECWLWTGSTTSGYGRIRIAGKTKYAHRTSYRLMVGEIPEGLQLDHLCRNRACVNPWHLEPVTSRVNTYRSPSSQRAKETCPNGHPYSGTNLNVWTDKRGYPHRICRRCNAQRSRDRYALLMSLPA